MIVGFDLASIVLCAWLIMCISKVVTVPGVLWPVLTAVFAAVFCVVIWFANWSHRAFKAFSYDGERKLSKDIIEGIAEYVTVPHGGIGLDVGCGSGALTIACAKRNPNAVMVGIDRWGKDYASFSKQLCEKNAEAEGVSNVRFEQGNAVELNFTNEYFDTVTSNYVYHNIAGTDRRDLLRETFRVLKKGGTFAIHDIMMYKGYHDIDAFVEELKNAGFEKVDLIDTTDVFMTKKEAKKFMLRGSRLLVGKK